MEEDGVVAIMLYEESLASRYGHSVLNLIPSPHFRDYELSAYLGNKVTQSQRDSVGTPSPLPPSLPPSLSPPQFDQQMKVLHSHILQFCKCHVPGHGPPSLLMPEE